MSAVTPFTPRPQRQRKSHLGLSQAEESRYQGTLASVRRVDAAAIREELEDTPDAAAIALAEARISERAERERPDSRRSLETDPRERRPISGADRPSSRFDREVRPSSASRRERDPKERERGERERAVERAYSRRSEGGPSRTERDLGRERERRDGRTREERERERERPTRTIDVEVVVREGEAPAEAPPSRLLDGVSLDIQEAWVCEDIMFLLQGVEGSLIRYAEGYDPLDSEQRLKGARWRVDPSLDPSLLSLLNRLLPLATFFTSVEASIELRNTPEFGMVSHALGSGIRGMLKEYRVLMAQLESLFNSSSTFTLQTLYFHLHPTLHTMSLLSSLCLALETDEEPADSDASDDDDFGGMAAELLGGEGIKGLMKNLKAQEAGGLIGGGGPVVGGEVLGIICEREATMSGDPTATTLHSQLLLHASQPYCRMLLRWITTGYLSDPFEEFMVKESGHITKGVLESDYTDEYWERRYTLRDGSSLAAPKAGGGKAPPSLTAAVPAPRQGTSRLPGGACIPAFLQPWKHKILLAGKYLNVMRECGIDVKKTADTDLLKGGEPVVINEPQFYHVMEDAYIHANTSLLKLLVEEQELIPHLRSLKHYFFADQSDFLTNFLDLASSDLTRKAAKSVSIVKLQSLLDLAVRNPASSSSNDPYKDNLKVTMASQGLYEWLLKIVSHQGNSADGDLDFGGLDLGAGDKDKSESGTLMGIDAIAFDYNVKFPLSLVISRKAVTRYQLIFRFLVHLHHLESGLSAMWLEQKTKLWRDSTGNADMDDWKTRVCALRARMLVFVRQMLAYATGEVLEANWRALEAKLANVTTVDQLMRDHVDFLDTCLKQCMLTNAKLLSVYAKLMKTITHFVNYSDGFSKSLTRFRADPLTESDATKSEHRWSILGKFEVNFNHHTNLHLDAVTYHAGSENVALLALVTRLHQTTKRI